MSASALVLLSGGLGGARLSPALRDRLGPGELTIVANVGDDLEWMGLTVSPDLDSISYALAGMWDGDRGWGRKGETFRVRDELVRLGDDAWFGVGDLDLAWHLERARMRRNGKTLAETTALMLQRLGIDDVTLLPASEERCRTRAVLEDGRTLDFQEWYVRERAEPPVRRALFGEGAASSATLAAVTGAKAAVLGPSNPVSSIGALLALRGLREAFATVPIRVAVSPVVAGREPATESLRHHALARRRLLGAEGLSDTPAAIAGLYATLVQAFLIDRADEADGGAVRSAGLEPIATDLLDPRALAETIAALVRR